MEEENGGGGDEPKCMRESLDEVLGILGTWVLRFADVRERQGATAGDRLV